MSIWCNYKYGKVSTGNYQYCLKCGKVNCVPCQHTFITLQEAERWIDLHGSRYKIGMRYTLRCTKCGIIKEVETGRSPNDY